MIINSKSGDKKIQGSKGNFETYKVDSVSADMSFSKCLMCSMQLIIEGKNPLPFDHDCREGICGACSMISVVVRTAQCMHTTCQLHMRHLRWRIPLCRTVRAPIISVIKDLVVDRSALTDNS